ncbi:MAG: hypothetical protein DRP56_06595 [Planctomycetota bacterium]|nr:MAG: hypothetical protein DRP56_06595 [Planctomycetota bacterium]
MSSSAIHRATVYQLTTRHAITDNRILNLMAETLSDAGYKSTVVGPHHEHFTFKNVQVIACPVTKNRNSKWIRYTAPWQLFWFALWNKDGKVFGIHDPDMLKIGLLLKLFGKRVIYDIHDDYEAAMKTRLTRLGKFSAWLISKVWWGYERSVSHFFDGITVADRHLEKKFAWKKPAVLGNAPPLDFTDVADTANEITFNMIYVGAVTQGRGISRVLDALKLLPYKDIRFDIIGNCSDDRITQQMESDSRVIYHGRIAWTELNKYYQKAHLGIAMYQKFPSFYYCTGENAVKIQEYMAAGMAVLTSNFPGLTKFVKDDQIGLVAQPDDPQAIAEKIKTLYKDRDLLKKLGRNGRRAFEEKYNWDLHKYKLLNLYSRIRF